MTFALERYTIFVFPHCKQTCHLLQKVIQFLSSQTDHYTNILGKNSLKQVEDIQKCERPMDNCPTLFISNLLASIQQYPFEKLYTSSISWIKNHGN